jgi:hypothetical protein
MAERDAVGSLDDPPAALAAMIAHPNSGCPIGLG